jgi:hypothetical protein
MIVAIHQPNYLPYYGYFHKIQNSDVFVFLDNVLYTKNSYINRNRIRTPKGWSWLTVPVQRKGSSNNEIRSITISNNVNWRKKHSLSLKYNYSKAKYFSRFHSLLEVYEKEWTYLAELNIYLIKLICSLLGIKCNFIRASELNVSGSKTDLLIDICKAVGGDVYLSGQGAKGYIEEKKFERSNIKLIYDKFEHPKYEQVFEGFIPNLSIVDILFNVGKL